MISGKMDYDREMSELTKNEELSSFPEKDLFRGKLQKLRIVSNNLSFGLIPGPDQEVEQRITLNLKGQVWFSAYAAGVPAPRLRRRSFRISADAAQRLLGSISRYFSQEQAEVWATDIGTWELELTNTDGEMFRFSGALCAEFSVDGIDLSDQIRRTLCMDDLFAFDGNNRPDAVNRICLEYHRGTEGGHTFRQSETEWEQGSWDVSERLVIDRAAGILELLQTSGSACRVSHTYQIPEDVAEFLNSLDAEELFDCPPRNLEDVCEESEEVRDYRLIIDFKRSARKVLYGSFDRNGLPSDFPEFAQAVVDFMRAHDTGEILDPGCYGHRRRQKNDYTFCRVIFHGGHKTYHYIADDDGIMAGDFVVVPAGKDNHESVAEVLEIIYCPAEEAPFPIEKTKHIIRKADDTDFVPPNSEQWSTWCPAINREVNMSECIEISDVANDYINDRILEDYDPPVSWNESRAEACRACKFHMW